MFMEATRIHKEKKTLALQTNIKENILQIQNILVQ